MSEVPVQEILEARRLIERRDLTLKELERLLLIEEHDQRLQRRLEAAVRERRASR